MKIPCASIGCVDHSDAVDDVMREWPEDVKRIAEALSVGPGEAAQRWLVHSCSRSAGWLGVPLSAKAIRDEIEGE